MKCAILRNEPEVFCRDNSIYPIELEWFMWKIFGSSIRVRFL
jgi:hypothetical protein